MGAKQRKHPATAAGPCHISFTGGAQSTTGRGHLCYQPAETVRMILKTLNLKLCEASFFFSQHDFVTFCFTRAFESELRMYDGDDPLDVWDR